jgi:hypothetical protein
VHAVEAAQKGRLAAARRTNQRRDSLFADFDVEFLERPDLAVIERQRLRARRRTSTDGRGVASLASAGCAGGGCRALPSLALVPVCMVLTS